MADRAASIHIRPLMLLQAPFLPVSSVITDMQEVGRVTCVMAGWGVAVAAMDLLAGVC